MTKNVLSGENISKLREVRKWSREDLASILNVTPKTIARWESETQEDKPSGTTAVLLQLMISSLSDPTIPVEETELLKTLWETMEVKTMKDTGDIIYNRVSSGNKEELAEICKALKIPVGSSVFKIVTEYRSVAGNSFANLFRSREISYKQILVDVANKMRPEDAEKFYIEDNLYEIDLENKIIEYFSAQIAKELNKLSEEERKKKIAQLAEKMRKNEKFAKGADEFQARLAAGGAITTAAVVALFTGPLTGAIFYSGVFASAWAGIFGMSSTLLAITGTGVGIAAVLPVFVLFLSAPSYKKTIPATLQLIGIRKRMEHQNR